MGEKKSFQEILDEQIKGQQKLQPPVPEKPVSSTPYVFEFDFSFLTRPTPVKSKAAAYPATPAPKKPTPKPTARPKDRVLETAKLTSVEVAALQIFAIKAEGSLSFNELKTKYRALVRRFHPDHHTANLEPLERQTLTEKFHTVLESYEILDQAFSRQIKKQL